MSRSTPDATRAHLANVLNDCLGTASALQDILENERHALEQRDTDTLSQAVTEKEARIRELALLEQDRGRICTDAGFGSSAEDMQALVNWCDKGTAIQSAWDHLRQVSADCDSMNLTNGAIIRLRQQQISDGLALLRGSERETDTYGPTGATGTTPGGRALTEA